MWYHNFWPWLWSLTYFWKNLTFTAIYWWLPPGERHCLLTTLICLIVIYLWKEYWKFVNTCLQNLALLLWANANLKSNSVNWHGFGWLVVLRIYVALVVFQPYRDLEAGDNQSLKFKWWGRESNSGKLTWQQNYDLISWSWDWIMTFIISRQIIHILVIHNKSIELILAELLENGNLK